MSENLLRDLGRQVFLREFSFSDAEYRAEGVGEFELGDHVVFLNQELLLFELKERQASDEPSADSERKWFKRAVLRDSITQFDGNLKRLDAGPVTVQNQAGDEITIRKPELRSIRRLATYTHASQLPAECLGRRGYESRRVGFVHVMPLADYTQVVEVLVTPAEIFEYLDFRQSLLERHGLVHEGVGEKAILGQYLENDLARQPDTSFAKHVDALDQDPADFDLFRFLSDHRERIIHSASNRSSDRKHYYRVLEEVAMLTRTGVKLLQERFGRVLADVRASRPQAPLRVNVGTGCTFVVIPVPASRYEDRLSGLSSFTELGKYTMQTSRAVGISCARDGNGFMIDWYFSEHPWEYREDIEHELKELDPFPGANYRVIDRYTGKELES